jgi:hypothetical protein
MSEMEPIVESRGQVFSVAGSPLAGFGVHGTVAERVNSSPKLLDLGEMGVYSSYTRQTYPPSCSEPKIINAANQIELVTGADRSI